MTAPHPQAAVEQGNQGVSRREPDKVAGRKRVLSSCASQEGQRRAASQLDQSAAPGHGRPVGFSAVLCSFPSGSQEGCPAQSVTASCDSVQRQEGASLCLPPFSRTRKCSRVAPSSFTGQRASHAATHHWRRGCVQPTPMSTHCPSSTWGGASGLPGLPLPEGRLDAANRKEVGRNYLRGRLCVDAFMLSASALSTWAARVIAPPALLPRALRYPSQRPPEAGAGASVASSYRRRLKHHQVATKRELTATCVRHPVRALSMVSQSLLGKGYFMQKAPFLGRT